ncbi:MAG: AMP-binding protein [Acidimicrobiales bacterium]
MYRRREVEFITRQAGSRLLVVPGVWHGVDYVEIAAGLEGVEVLVAAPGLPDGDPSIPPPPSRADDVRWLYYTSGTTAEPKGARHTDTTVIAGARSLAAGMAVTAEDRSSLVFPFSHIGGTLLLTVGLLTGCTHIVADSFDPATTIDVLAREGVTLAGSGTPFHLAYLSRQREHPTRPLLPRVRAFPGGASPKPRAHFEMKRELGGIGILSSYGLTEAPILTVNRPSSPDEELATGEGRPGPGVLLGVVDGELRVKGPQVFKGYVDASLDAAAFDEDGWFRTGDQARIDPAGYVVITGRLKDVIIRKGENISAKEVEDILYRHPKVADVAVIGLPDPAVGERCCAVVVPADPRDTLRFDEMVSHLRGEELMAQKIPEQLEIVDACPRNSAGKVLKHELQQRYAK